MKTLKEFILESEEDELDDKICANIKDELETAGIETYYVEPDVDEEYTQVYVATCNYADYGRWQKVLSSTELVNIVENTGVEYLRENTSDIMYNGKKAFEIIFADRV